MQQIVFFNPKKKLICRRDMHLHILYYLLHIEYLDYWKMKCQV